MKRKELLLLLGSVTVTLLAAIGLIRWFAPGLLGIAPDLQMVQVSKEVPPFFDNLFREEDRRTREFLINDPYTVLRARPFYPDVFSMGPNDALGFRNRHVPNAADIVTIGDSQTYGNNAVLELNWPNRLKAHLSARRVEIYNMSVGAWNGPQYFYMFSKAQFFQPKVVVVAFYTGNDPIGAFVQSYGSDEWKSFRLDPSLSKEDAPELKQRRDDAWPVRFRDGTSTVFTPAYRYTSNNPDNKAVRVGYRILEEVARRIAVKSAESKVPVVFTIIPTKELVYEKRLGVEGVPLHPEYRALVSAERVFLKGLADAIRQIPNVGYVDVLSPLEQAALKEMLYPPDGNGHPQASGYEVIASAIAPFLKDYLPLQKHGLAAIKSWDGNPIPVLLMEEGYLLFSSMDLFFRNGWRSPQDGQQIEGRDIVNLPFLGYVDEVDPARFGPPDF